MATQYDMDDPVVANALKKKAKLEKELAAIDQFLTMHRRFSPAAKNSESPQVIVEESPRITLMRRGPRPAMFAAAIDRILRRVGEPMTRGELADAVEKEGLEIPSSDKAKYLGTILWRESARFENHEGRGYWLKGVPIPTTIEEKFNLAMGPMVVGSNRT